MWNDQYQWHFDYTRIAWDSGFQFNRNTKNYINEKNKFCLIDIERIIQERDLPTVELFLPDVIKYRLDDEQAEILDNNFVKMLKVSQLSIEYLLFCRKYLDKVVVSLKDEIKKLKEENAELKNFTEQLENHITTLSGKELVINEIPYKCVYCSKVFTSESYLASHIQRRHHSESSDNSDANKLHLEIKELKERLNSTEKLIQDQTVKEEIEKKDVIEEKFSQFKLQIENELKVLQMRNNFYEDKYIKLFDIATNSITNMQEVNKLQENDYEVNKLQSATQTEIKPKEVNLTIEVISDKNVFDFKDASSENSVEIKEQDEIQSESQDEDNNNLIMINEFQEKLSKLEVNIEEKVSVGFKTIETQMQSFWETLTEIQCNFRNQSVKNDLDQIPIVKPRSKCEDVIPLKKVTPLNIQHDQTMYASSVLEDTTDESSAKDDGKPVTTTTLENHTIQSLKNVANDETVLGNLREEVENVVQSRLRELGISHDWKGIPKRTFERSMEIVTHQANLTKKNFKEFASIRCKIEKMLLKNKNLSVQELRVAKKEKRKKKIVKEAIVPTINRSFYDTDTDSAEAIQTKYAVVVDELKNRNETKKGVLKSFPLTSATNKKKVLFDVDSESSKLKDDKPILQTVKEGGSTTSVASSVLDRDGRTQREDKKEGYESVSDFEL